MSNFMVGIHLFLQLAVIIGVCRAMGWLGQRYLGQTQVFMEMLAGIVMGPSLLGLVSPQLQEWLFPKRLVIEAAAGAVEVTHPNMVILYALAQVGLVLYMFVVGLELDIRLLRGRARSAGLVSSVGITVPFVAATALLPILLARGDMFGAGGSWAGSWLFVGASIAVTAFPMLARILDERGLIGTPLGTLTLAAGSFDDSVAWCLLAVVLAFYQSSPAIAIITLAGGATYAAVMLTVGRWGFRRAAVAWERRGGGGGPALAVVMVVVMSCAFITDGIGIHAVVGAFLCGAAMPKGALSESLRRDIERLTTTLLLPIFFVYSGLNTRIALLDSVELWMVAALIITLSIVSKGVACMLAARVAGETWRDSVAIGALMNARGMMELILLNVGLERGIITPTFFAIMAIMAVVTTGLASPLCKALIRTPVRAVGSAGALVARAGP